MFNWMSWSPLVVIATMTIRRMLTLPLNTVNTAMVTGCRICFQHLFGTDNSAFFSTQVCYQSWSVFYNYGEIDNEPIVR